MPTEFQRPDPAIYSQQQAIASGLEPTWESPDIVSNDRWPWVLLSELELTIHNRSAQASAVNTVVQLSYSDFGIGMPQTTHSVSMTSVGPGGAINLVLPTGGTLLSGDPSRGFFVRISHPHDTDKSNNVGDQVHTAVRTSEAGRQGRLAFPLRNPTGSPVAIQLSVLANDIGGSVTPGLVNLGAFAQTSATLHWDVPGPLPGAGPTERRLTVLARVGPALLGGLTVIVEIDS